MLLAARRALTHHEIERQVRRAGMDRVTIYRVLEWLVECGLAHRIAGDDRVWRFNAPLRRLHTGAPARSLMQLICIG